MEGENRPEYKRRMVTLLDRARALCSHIPAAYLQSYVRPCAQGRCGRCPPGSGVMSDFYYYFFFLWSEDKIKADPFLLRSRVQFRVPPWVSNTIARDHLA